MAGFIVIDRKIKDWRWYHNITALGLWTYILMETNWADCYLHDGTVVPRGSFATSIPRMAGELGVSESTIRRWLKRFESEGQIEQRVTNKYRVIKVLKYSTYQDFSKEPVTGQQTGQPKGQAVVERCSDDRQNNQENHTNQTNNTTKDIYTAESKLVMDYLNRKTGKAYKYVESNMKHIRARFKEGYKMADFEKVIDSKYAQWHNDQKMSKFLRPETLFGTKFDSYLNEASTSAPDFTNPDYYAGDDW